MNSESGIVFFADGILARTFKRAADRLSDTCLVIEQKDFFEDLHEIVSYSEHRLCQWSAPADRIFYPPIFTEQLQPALLTLWCTGRVSRTRHSAKRPPSAIS